MAPIANFDFSWASSEKVGAGRGLERDRIRRRTTAIHAAHRVLSDVRRAGELPLTSEGFRVEAGWAKENAPVWRKDFERLVIVGEPGTVANIVGLASLRTLENIRVVDGPDPRHWLAIESGVGRAHIVVLSGPDWVMRLARGLPREGNRFTVVTGDGTGGPISELPAGWERVDTRWAADARFGRVSRIALCVAAWSGVELTRLVENIEGQLEICERARLDENPAYGLALAVHLLETEANIGGMFGLIPLGGQRIWADGLCRVWASMTARKSHELGEASGDGVATSLLVGDELGIQALVGGEMRRWAWVVWSDHHPADRPMGENASLWSFCRELMTTQVRQLGEAGCPVLRLRLPRMEPEEMAAIDVLILMSLLTLGALRGCDPLEMRAADRFRGLHDDANGDSGGDRFPTGA